MKDDPPHPQKIQSLTESLSRRRRRRVNEEETSGSSNNDGEENQQSSSTHQRQMSRQQLVQLLQEALEVFDEERREPGSDSVQADDSPQSENAEDEDNGDGTPDSPSGQDGRWAPIWMDSGYELSFIWCCYVLKTRPLCVLSRAGNMQFIKS